MFFTIILILLVTIIGLNILYYSRKLKPYNQRPLDIKTFDGSNSPYHPSVAYFKNGWNGYKYWMVETPFSPKSKPYMDRNECPSIHVSNDGYHWCEIARNPIDDLSLTEIEQLDYFSDPHLVYANGNLECWYRLTHRNGIYNNFENLQLIRKCSSNGIQWSDREIMVNLAEIEGDALGNMVVSPAIIYKKGKYRMWYVNSESREQRGLSYSESADGHKWEKTIGCTLQGAGNNPWHIDVNYIDGKYILLSYDFKDITLWESDNGINFKFVKLILTPSIPGSFYGDSLYRACIIKDTLYKVYFSCSDFFCTHIGLLEGKNINEMSVKPSKKHLSPIDITIFLIRKKICSAIFITKTIIKRLK